MDSPNDLHAEILSTIEAIDRTQRQILFHQALEDKSVFMIEQYQHIKKYLTRQLRDLLIALDVDTSLMAA